MDTPDITLKEKYLTIILPAVTASNPNLVLSSRFKLELYGRNVEYTKRTIMAKGMKLAPSSVKEIFFTFFGAWILWPRVLESTKVRSS